MFGGSKKPFKFEYNVSVHYLMNVPKAGVLLYISWKRGKKRSGGTKKTIVKDKTAVWEEDFVFTGTLFKDAKADVFKKKLLNIYIHEDVDSKTNKVVGSLNVNLGDFSSIQGEVNQTKLFTVKLWNSTEVQLKATIRSRLLASRPGSNVFTGDLTTMTDATEENSDDEEAMRGRGAPAYSPPPFGARASTSRPVSLPADSSKAPVLHYNDPAEDFSPTFTATGGLGTDPDTLTMTEGGSKVKRKKKKKRASGITGDDTGDANNTNVQSQDNGTVTGHDSEEDETKPSTKTAGATATNGGEGSVGVGSAVAASNDKFAFLKQNIKNRRRNNLSLQLTEEDTDAIITNMNRPLDGLKRKLREAGDPHTLSREAILANAAAAHSRASVPPQDKEAEMLRKQLAAKKRDDEERVLLDSFIIFADYKFCNDMPLSSYILFKAFKHWDCFSPNKSAFLTKVTKAIEQVVQRGSTNNELLCYFLCTTCALLNMLQRDFPVSIDEVDTEAEPDAGAESTNGKTGKKSNNGVDANRRPQNAPFMRLDLETLFSGQQSATVQPEFVGKSKGSGDGSVAEDDFAFESPVSQFRNEARSLAYRIYALLLRNAYKELNGVLLAGMFDVPELQQQRTSSTGVSVGDVIKVLTDILRPFKSNNVYPELGIQFFNQLCYFIDAYIFNTLMTQRDYCSMREAIALKMNITRVEDWVRSSIPQSSSATTANGTVTSPTSPNNSRSTPPSSLLYHDEFSYSLQASNLMIMNKAAIVEETVRLEVCPLLNMVQIRTALKNYHPDEFDPNPVPASVFNALPNPDDPSYKKDKTLCLDSSAIYKPSLVLEAFNNIIARQHQQLSEAGTNNAASPNGCTAEDIDAHLPEAVKQAEGLRFLLTS